jgi:hypothetical protein
MCQHHGMASGGMGAAGSTFGRRIQGADRTSDGRVTERRDTGARSTTIEVRTSRQEDYNRSRETG